MMLFLFSFLTIYMQPIVLHLFVKKQQQTKNIFGARNFLWIFVFLKNNSGVTLWYQALAAQWTVASNICWEVVFCHEL